LPKTNLNQAFVINVLSCLRHDWPTVAA